MCKNSHVHYCCLHPSPADPWTSTKCEVPNEPPELREQRPLCVEREDEYVETICEECAEAFRKGEPVIWRNPIKDRVETLKPRQSDEIVPPKVVQFTTEEQITRLAKRRKDSAGLSCTIT